MMTLKMKMKKMMMVIMKINYGYELKRCYYEYIQYK